jgi:hypothetical protein
MTVRAIICVLILALQTAPASATPALPDGAHDFDFQFGTWSVHVQRLMHPLSGSKTWANYDGVHVVAKVWNGRANLGVLEIDGPSGHIEGQSLRLYSPQTRQWSFTFAAARTGTLGTPMVGEFRNGRGEFFDQETYDGRAVFVRSITSNVTPSSYRDEYAYSQDGGATWETNWIATYTLLSRDETPPPSQAAAGGESGQHDFDFEFGAWTMHLRRLLHPLANSSEWASYDGPSVVRKVWNGRANLGEIELEGVHGHLEGLSLRLYDPQAHQWNISFANGAAGVLATPPTIGEFKGGRGEFYDQEFLDGRAIFARFIFSDVTARSFHFEQAYSADGGASWEVNWIADFTR